MSDGNWIPLIGKTQEWVTTSQLENKSSLQYFEGLYVYKTPLLTEISESLEKVSVSTTFAESRKVLISKNPKLQSRESLGLEETENLSLEKVSVSTISIE